MLRILLLTLYFVLMACASSPSGIIFLSSTEPGASDNSILISRCNLECNELLKSAFVFETPTLFPVVAPAIINAIDGITGSVTIKCELCAHTATEIYNDPDKFGFEIHLPPGEHLVHTSKNHLQSSFAENVPVAFDSRPGHRYFIGNITQTFEGDTWSPVVVDLTEGVVIYPDSPPW